MAFNKFFIIILVLSLVSYSSFTEVNCSAPSPNPAPTNTAAPPSSQGQCPIDASKLGVCCSVISHIIITNSRSNDNNCCELIDDLTDLEAATCICITLKAKAAVLGKKFDITNDIGVILNTCQKTIPPEYKCV
ncbi:pEARLI1-like lipid transfer protein 3 [Vicia villosa]|uniref:pEARLI1-like lipid transfer protein 3 n=1 Tax=Vicia villosa TaxID=3911 RepID=UPI00273AD056|nr:pEARLI1-like lipid transfer protein 3 [Vicia villosa]